MASTLAYQARTSVRPAEPGTLVGKLTARQREYAELDTILVELSKDAEMPSHAFTTKINLADRRVAWAWRRLNEIEQKIAELPKDSARRERLCMKAYGCSGIPVGVGNVYESGALAYIEDAHTGDDGPVHTLVPCRVIKISDEDVSVEITANRPGYAKGECITTSHRDAIPRGCVEKPKSRDYVVNYGWFWAQD